MLTKSKLIECSPKQNIIRKESTGKKKKKGISAFGKLRNYDFGIICALFPSCYYGCLRAACPAIGPGWDTTVEVGKRIFSQELGCYFMFPEV